MTKIMKEVKRHGWRSYMRNTGALVQLAVGNKLHPESNRIVIQTHEANIAFIEFGLIKAALIRATLTGNIYSLTLHAASQTGREVKVLTKHIGL